MFILLIGPKGSGKSHVGRLLEREFDVHFFHVEPHWMAYYAECEEAGRPPTISEGIDRIRPLIVAAMDEHRHLCIETTGASCEILEDLLSVGRSTEMILVRVQAPISVCLDRIATRESTHQIPIESDEINRIYAQSSAVDLPFDTVLENVAMSDAAIVDAFRPWISV